MKKRSIHILSSLLLLTLPLFVGAYNFKKIDIADGLSNNTVKCITQDVNGFMWFGTYDGLCRYDGVNFRIFRNDKNDPFSLRNNFITSILECDSGLYIGTKTGLDFLSFNDYKFYSCTYTNGVDQPQKIDGFIRKIIAVNDRIIILSGTRGLLTSRSLTSFGKLQLRKEMPTFFAISNYNENQILGHSSNGLYIIDLLKADISSQVLYGKNMLVDDIYYNQKQDRIYVGYGIGEKSRAFREDNGVLKELKLEIPEGVKCMLEYNGYMLFGTDGNGLVKTDQKENITLNPATSNISSDAIYSMFCDKENNLWVGTFRGGINLYSKRNDWFKSLTTGNSNLKHKFVTSFFRSSGGKLYIGTDGGGLNVYDPQMGVVRAFDTDNSNISGNNVLSLAGDENYIYLGIYGGSLNRYNPVEKSFTKYALPVYPGNPEKENVWVIKDDNRGNIWIGAEAGLFCFNKQKETIFIVNSSIRNITEITFDNSSIWISTNGKGLYETDFSGNILKHYHQDSDDFKIPNNIVRYVFIDSKEQVWFGTEYNGLFRINSFDGSVMKYGSGHGFSNPNVLGIVEDGQNNLWIGSYDGLFRFNVKEEKFLRFGIRDGLPSAQFNYNACYKNGENIYFGTAEGMLFFSPAEINFDSGFKEVVFTGFELLNNPDDRNATNIGYRTCPKEIELPYNKNFFTISFSLPELVSPNKISFSCFMDDFENSWQQIGAKRQVSYTNVPSGEYTFKVRATNCNGNWNENYSSLAVTITPPWWETGWAKSLFILFALGLLVLGFLFYRHETKMKHQVELKEIEKKSLERINEEKLRFFTNISHELRTPIFLLTAPIEELLESRNKFIKVSRSHLKNMHQNALRLNKLISRIIDFRKLEAGKLKLELQRENIVAFCKELVANFETICEQKGIVFLFLPSKVDIQLVFDPEKMESIVSNLISNAIKYTPENGKIILSIDDAGESVAISIKDNGIGIPKDQQESIFNRFVQVNEQDKAKGDGIGLAFVKHLVELHKGEINLESESGVGSAFTFSIPKTLEAEITNNQNNTEAKVLNTSSSKVKLGIQDNLENPTVSNSILIVDDETEIVETIERALIGDFKILKAYNGIEALSVIREKFPDLIISDVMMPKMNGIELVSTLKKDKNLAHIPVLMLTAKTAEEDMLKAFECGADAYLTKPVSLNFLKKRIAHLLSQAESVDIGQFVTGQKNNYSKEEKRFLNKCKNILNDQLANSDFSVSDFAEAAGMSHSAFYKKIKSLTGKSVIGFVNEYRIYRAVKYFNEGETNISTVLAKCGFNDARNFRDTFKRRMGVSPKEYIKR